MFDLEGNRIAEYLYDDVAQTSSLLREYVWLDGVAVAVIENDTVYYVRTDHIGRPVFATDDTGTKVWEGSYLPFGGVQTYTGTPIALRFPGQWFQSESGLHQNWMRDYDPTTGRYLQADPLGLVDGASVYNYALQNPGRYTDPRGENIRPTNPLHDAVSKVIPDRSCDVASVKRCLKKIKGGAVGVFIFVMCLGTDVLPTKPKIEPKPPVPITKPIRPKPTKPPK